MVDSIQLSSRKFCRSFINRLLFNSSCVRDTVYVRQNSRINLLVICLFFFVVNLVSAMIGMFERSLFLNLVLGF